MGLKQELIRVSLPTIDRELPANHLIFSYIFSSSFNQSITCSLAPETGTPKYLIGQTPVAQLKISEEESDL